MRRKVREGVKVMVRVNLRVAFGVKVGFEVLLGDRRGGGWGYRRF